MLCSSIFVSKKGGVLRVDLRALLKGILGHSFYKIFGSRMYGPGTLLVYITGQKKQVAKSGTWRDLIFVNMF